MNTKIIKLFVFLCLIIGISLESQAQQGPRLESCMDAIVTCYSDSGMMVAGVKRIGDPLNNSAPFSTNWSPLPTDPLGMANQWLSQNIGQVFGIAIDQAGAVYLASTSMYYVNNTAGPQAGSARRLAQLPINTPTMSVAASNNSYSGYNVSGGPAGIYKSPASNLATVNVLTSSSTGASGTGVGTRVIHDNGYGIGNICAHDKYIYATVLDDGNIYKIDASTGTILQMYDPFSVDNGNNQIAPYGERLFAVATRTDGSTTRLYFSRLISSNVSEIHSVELLANGNIATGTEEMEIVINAIQNYVYISDIAFSTRGEMLVAENGPAHSSRVFQFFGQHKAWSKPYFVPTGYGAKNNSAGGVDYGTIAAFNDNTKKYCDSIIWAMSNSMYQTTWYGAQGIPYLQYDNTYNDYVVDLGSPYKSEFGDIEFYGECCPAKPTDICDLVDVDLASMDSCCYEISVLNGFDSTYFSQIIIESSTGYTIQPVNNISAWAAITYQDPHNVVMDGGMSNLPRGVTGLANLCVEGNGPGLLTFYFIGNAPQMDTVCVIEKEIDCAGAGNIQCLDVQQDISCTSGNYQLTFSITNQSNFTMRGITLYPLTAGIRGDLPYTNIFVPIADLSPGNSGTYSIPIDMDDTVGVACFYYAACDINVRPFVSGQTPDSCCMDSVIVCSQVPICDPCDGLTIDIVEQDSTSDDCCFDLSLTNNLATSNISCIRFIGQGGTQFAIFGSNWNIQAPVSSGFIELCEPGHQVPLGTINNFAQLCLTGTSISPHSILVEYVDTSGELVCTQELQFPDCDIVPSQCLQMVNDSLYCEGGKRVFSFDVINNSPFAVYQIDVRTADSSVFTTPWYFKLDTPIAPGASRGRFQVSIDTADEDLDFLCLYLTAHNAVYDSVTGTGASLCCTDSLGGICLPFIDCDSISMCCDVESFIVPSGLTPNQDGFNDKLKIENSDACKKVKIVVYNRWGNIVYQNDDYKNDWTGQSSKGKLLPQGTYYILLEGDNGAKRGLYLDLRY